MSPCRPLLLLQLLLVLLKWLTSASASEPPASPAPNTKPGCRPMCGNISVPYPFGIGHGCHIEEKWFNLTCHSSKLYFGNDGTQVIEILSLQGQLSINTSSMISWECYNSSGLQTHFSAGLTDGSLFSVAHPRNKITGIGCDTEALIRANWGGDNITETGCLSVCFEDQVVQDHPCSGVGCCQAEIPPGMKSFDVSVRSFSNHSRVLDFNPCSYAFLIDKVHNFNTSTIVDLLHSRRYKPAELKIPVVLDWTIGNQTCYEAQKNQDKFACKSENSACDDYRIGGIKLGYGYRCSCRDGYRGNPYLEGGCQDIDECAENKDMCQEICVNTPGNYFCKRHSNKATVILSVSLSLSCIFIVISWIFWGLKRRKLIKLKEKYFHKNGGLLLQQQIKAHGVTVATKIFSAEELKKATNNYDETRIVGKGAYGTVYKGILADSTVVAIKKSIIVDENQIEQFINEVFILSQINHRNVVKLLGCCLETQVPLLVYEFIFNGTLFSHIHDEALRASLSCNDRLRIASETAGALAYLHYAAVIPIFHRDVKSTNILLDDNMTAKVSDFGASRLVPVDQTQISTLVKGTIGYLDPEYFRSGQLTEKSDVYSFGVVLVELLTGDKPTSLTRSGEDIGLAMYFLSSMERNRLFQVLEDRVVGECEVEHLLAVAQLAKRCLNLRGEERPTMKEVAAELEMLRSVIEQPRMDSELEEILSVVSEELESCSSAIEGDNLEQANMSLL